MQNGNPSEMLVKLNKGTSGSMSPGISISSNIVYVCRSMTSPSAHQALLSKYLVDRISATVQIGVTNSNLFTNERIVYARPKGSPYHKSKLFLISIYPEPAKVALDPTDEMGVYRDKYTEDEHGRDILIPVEGPTVCNGRGLYLLEAVIFEDQASGDTWDITFRLILNGEEIRTLVVPVEVQ
ncbi:hypothetical protein IL306_009954 [Fusarium sp. DS 682]|nr:hypothetical protein IL306_009954 [Fusarium sp. DS 682]